MLILAIGAVAFPRLAGWALPASLVWYAALIALVYGAHLALVRTAARWGIRSEVPEGERIRLLVPVRRRVGRLPYTMLGDELAVALTDRRLLIQPRSIFTGRPRGMLHRGRQVALKGRFLMIETEAGARIDAVAPLAHRPDVDHWIARWKTR